MCFKYQNTDRTENLSGACAVSMIYGNTPETIKKGLNYVYVKDDCQEKRQHGTPKDMGAAKWDAKERQLRCRRSHGAVRCRRRDAQRCTGSLGIFRCSFEAQYLQD